MVHNVPIVQATVVPKDLDVDVPFDRPLSLCDPSLMNAILFLDTLPCFRPLTDSARRTVFPDRIGKQDSPELISGISVNVVVLSCKKVHCKPGTVNCV